MNIEPLEIVGVIGFDGLTKHGLQLHPDQKHFIYSMGNKVTIKNIDNGEQNFLSGHTNVVTTLRVSPCGKYIASGQLTHLGFKALVIIWNYKEKNMKANYEIHRGKIEDICFSCKGNYLFSLGGKDDGNVIVWDIERNVALCGAFASTGIAGNATAIMRTNLRNECFLTGGNETLRVWTFDPQKRKITSINVKMGKLRRCVNCICIDDEDENVYWGTSTGDIIKTNLNYDADIDNSDLLTPPVLVGCYSKAPKDIVKLMSGIGDLYSAGVTSLFLLPSKNIIVGAGDGTIELIEITSLIGFLQGVKLPSSPQIKTLKQTKVRGAITSIIPYNDQSLIIGTSHSETYELSLEHLTTKLIVTCHTDAVYDVVFPHNFSNVFATGSKNDIRIWQLQSQKELLRIIVPNFVCTCVCFSYDGTFIISAWNDGIVRAFKPQSGSLHFIIENAHIKAVSAIGITRDGKTIVTGGCDGQVRVWQILKSSRVLKSIMKEHRGPITSLHISDNDNEVASSSTDGTCVIWDLINCIRKHIIIGNTMYMSVKFHPNSLQLLTCGTDRKVAYYETLDGSIVREVEGSTIGAINCLDIHPNGKYFVTAGNDCLVKFWEYSSADITHIGTGHAAIVTACKFSPDGRYIVSTSADGTVIIWKNPINSVRSSQNMRSVNSSNRSNRSSQHSTRNNNNTASRNRNASGSSCENENIGNISRRSAESIATIKTVCESKKHRRTNDLCDYDPLQPSKDNCQSKNHENEMSVISNKMSKSSLSDRLNGSRAGTRKKDVNDLSVRSSERTVKATRSRKL